MRGWGATPPDPHVFVSHASPLLTRRLAPPCSSVAPAPPSILGHQSSRLSCSSAHPALVPAPLTIAPLASISRSVWDH